MGRLPRLGTKDGPDSNFVSVCIEFQHKAGRDGRVATSTRPLYDAYGYLVVVEAGDPACRRASGEEVHRLLFHSVSLKCVGSVGLWPSFAMRYAVSPRHRGKMII